MKWLKYPLLATLCRVVIVIAIDDKDMELRVTAVAFIALLSLLSLWDIRSYIRERKLKKQAIDNAR